MSERFSNLVELFERSVERFADRPLFGTKRADGWAWSTYREVADAVDRCRAGLATLGVGRGDRVAIVANSRLEWAVVAFATYGRGAALVPMYEAQLASEWEFILGDSGAKVAIAATDPILSSLREAHPRLPALERVVGLSLAAGDPDSFAALLARGAEAPVESVHPAGTDVANLIYTSGTTGKPKGVVLSHDNIASNVSAVHVIYTFEPEDRALSFLPWAHAYGQVTEVFVLPSMGCSIAINDELPHLVANLEEVKPTILFAVPRIFNRLYTSVWQELAHRPSWVRGLVRAGLRGASMRTHGERAKVKDALARKIVDRVVFSGIRAKLGGRLKYAISASAALGKDVAEFIDALGLPVYEGYGLTETSPIVSANYPGHKKLGSVGPVLPGVRVAIDESHGTSEGEGEIVVYGPNVMQGYHNRPDENATAILPDGGFRTGDLGYVDDDGYLFITGRIKEQFKLENGKYVQPVPIEEELKLSPFVSNAIVTGDGRPYCAALVVLDVARVRAWAEEQGLEIAAPESDARVRELVAGEIASLVAGFKSYERPRAFAMTIEDFTTDNGMITPTLKLKRRNVLARYGALLDALYEPRESDQRIGTSISVR